MRSLGDLLKNHTGNFPVWKKVQAAMVVEEANEVLFQLFGEESKKYARAMYIKDKALAIACLSSVMAQEIRLNQQLIVEKINKKLGQKIVEKIKYLS